MDQSTKLFISLMLLFVLYATMKGHLKAYLQLLWGNSAGQTLHDISPAGQALQAAGITIPKFGL